MEEQKNGNTKIEKHGGALFKVSKEELGKAAKKKETIHLKDEDGIFLGDFTVHFKGDRYDLKGVVQSCVHVWKEFFEENHNLFTLHG